MLEVFALCPDKKSLKIGVRGEQCFCWECSPMLALIFIALGVFGVNTEPNTSVSLLFRGEE